MTDVAPEKLRQLAAMLRELAKQESGETHDLKSWYASARTLEKWIRGNRGLANIVPHFVWHFLADADIRRKSPDYAEAQLRQLSRVVSYLERGEIPPDSV